MNPTQAKSVSKFLSLVLRHQPEVIGIELTEEGWVDLDTLITAANSEGKQLTRDIVLGIVHESDKQRFAISDDGRMIRANQGHSISVDLKLEPQSPPPQLYHGTVDKFLSSIKEQGLTRGARQFVHLSADLKTAESVGSRRGKPVVLVINTAEMSDAGFLFYRSQNGVWLTNHIPVKYLQFPE